MKVVATYSIKGGVGKTTASVNLAHAAASTGARVLVWDLDPQGAATFFLRVAQGLDGGAPELVGGDGELARHRRASDIDGIHVVPADFSLRQLDLHLTEAGRAKRRVGDLLEPLHDAYDVAFLDCPAGITLSSESVFRAADALLVPTVPTPLSLRTLEPLIEFLATVRNAPEVWPFVSMYDWRKAMHKQLLAALADHEPPFFATAIPNSSAVERMGRLRQPVGQCAPRTTAAKGYTALWTEIAARLWGSD